MFERDDPQNPYSLSLDLSLGPNPNPNPNLTNFPQNSPQNSRQTANSRRRRRIVKSLTVPAPFPWSTNLRATIHSLKYLRSKQISKISGEVQCTKCQKQYKVQYDLLQKFDEISDYVAKNRDVWHDRAPSKWMNPVLPPCEICKGENCAKPVIARKKRAINWLFLLLGETIGCCTLQQLKYLCKHTNNHRTGAKGHVVYDCYLALCKQLDPRGPFYR